MALILLLLACAPALRERGLESAVTTAEALDQELESRRFAVLVGVDRYADPAFPDLRHAGADAKALADALQNAAIGAFDEVTVLDGEHAGRADILGALRVLAADAHRRDTVVVYFSGHGTRVRAQDGWHRYLVPADGRAANLEATALDLAELQRFFGTIEASRKALVVDACFDGTGKSAVAPADLQAPDLPPLAPPVGALGLGEAHLFATTAGRPALESDRLGHGVYSQFLLEALSWGFAEADVDGDGLLTAWEAHDHARGRTIAFTDGAQVPEAALRVIGEANVVLGGDPARRKARERALLYAYGRDLEGARVVIDGRERGALPGAVAVEPGPHHVVITDVSGEVRADGTVRLAPGRGYRAEHLVRQVQGPRRLGGARGVVVASAPFALAIGEGATGFEAWTARRVTGRPARGLTATATAGGAISSGRAGVDDPRGLAWISAEAGYQADRERWRLRAGLGPTLLVLPPDRLPGEHRDSEVGWWVAAAGPSAGLGFALNPDWVAGVQVRTHLAWLDLDRGHEWVPWTWAGAGVEAAW